MPIFNKVDDIDPSCINWSVFVFHRNNRSYAALLAFCRFVLESMIPTKEKGKYRTLNFLDEKMPRLFEDFVRGYYRRHLDADSLGARKITWNLDSGDVRHLPAMRTDVTITCGDRTLIIDTKYYTESMSTRYDKETFRSDNLYQIYSYVKNQDSESTGNVSGVLLYAKTKEDVNPDADFSVSGNRIGLKTLNLNLPFKEIAEQLDSLVAEYFGNDILSKKVSGY